MTEVFEKLLISDFDSEDFDGKYNIDYVLDLLVPLWPPVILEIASTFPQLAEKKCRCLPARLIDNPVNHIILNFVDQLTIRMYNTYVTYKNK